MDITSISPVFSTPAPAASSSQSSSTKAATSSPPPAASSSSAPATENTPPSGDGLTKMQKVGLQEQQMVGRDAVDLIKTANVNHPRRHYLDIIG